MLNECMNGKMSVTPTEGMIGTKFVGSDRYQVICAKVLSPKRVLVFEFSDIPAKKVVDGIEYFDGDWDAYVEAHMPKVPEWAKNESPEDIEEIMKRELDQMTYIFRKNKRWLVKGESMWSTGAIHWGAGDEYRDPSF